MAAANSTENLGVGFRRVLVVGPERTPPEEIHLLGYIKRTPSEDLQDKRLADGKGVLIQVSTSSIFGESFNNSRNQEEIPKFESSIGGGSGFVSSEGKKSRRVEGCCSSSSMAHCSSCCSASSINHPFLGSGLSEQEPKYHLSGFLPTSSITHICSSDNSLGLNHLQSSRLEKNMGMLEAISSLKMTHYLNLFFV